MSPFQFSFFSFWNFEFLCKETFVSQNSLHLNPRCIHKENGWNIDSGVEIVSSVLSNPSFSIKPLMALSATSLVFRSRVTLFNWQTVSFFTSAYCLQTGVGPARQNGETRHTKVTRMASRLTGGPTSRSGRKPPCSSVVIRQEGRFAFQRRDRPMAALSIFFLW